MAGNKITLVAEIDPKESKKVIQGQLEKLGKKLDLQVNCSINKDSINDIKKQLSSLSANINVGNPSINLEPKVNVKVDKNKIAKDIQTGVNEAIKNQKISVNLDSQKKLYQEKFGVEENDVSANWLKDAKENIIGFEIQVKEAGGIVETFRHQINELGEVKLTSITGSDKGIGAISRYISRAEKDLEKFKATHSAITWGLETPIKKVNDEIKKLNNGTGSIEAVETAFNELNKTTSEVEKHFKAASASFNIDNSATNKANNFANELKTIQIEIDKLNASSTKTNILGQINSIQEDIDKLDVAKDNKNLNEWSALYEKINFAIQDIINNLKIAKKEDAVFNKEFNQALREENIEVSNAVNKIGQAYKDINSYKNKSFNAGSSERERYAQEIDYLQRTIGLEKTRLENQGLLTDKVKEEIAVFERKYNFNRDILLARSSDKETEQKEKQLKLEQQQLSVEEYWAAKRLESVKALTAENEELKRMKQYYIELDKVSREFSSTNKSLNSNINTAINRLASQSNNVTFRNNAGNADVSNQLTQIDTLRSKYQSLLLELQKASTPEALVTIQEELNKLRPELDETVRSSKELQATLKKDSFATSNNNKIQKLAADMDKFAKANKRAVKSTKQMSSGMTFADKWNELSSRIANGADLSADEIKHLREEMAIFGQEAEVAGLNGENAFGRFLNGFKQMTTYISAQAVWGFAKRQISEMIQEVESLDKAMIELKKVTDETDASYKKYLKSAKKQSKDLHTTTSNIVAQTAEWSKLGYSIEQAQNLATTSMIYSKVGEVDNETAVEDLVATMKAFNIEAGNSIQIVNRLNKLGNEFSTDAKELGSGLKVSASTLAMAGNDISQTLALLTGGTEITQNAQEMGTALRTISLRLRGKLMPPYKEIYMLG